MTYTSSRRLRHRAADRQAIIKEKLITFLIDREWFAVSVLAAFRVAPISELTGGPRGSGIVFYAGHQVSLINTDKVIFHRKLTRKLNPYALLLLGNLETCLQGVLIDSPPILRNISQTNLIELPKGSDREIFCIHSLTMIKETVPLYLLDLHKIVTTLTDNLRM